MSPQAPFVFVCIWIVETEIAVFESLLLAQLLEDATQMPLAARLRFVET